MATLVIINVFPLLEMLKSGKFGEIAIIKFCLNTTLLTATIVIILSPITISAFGSFSANAIIAIIPASLIFGIILPLIFPLMILPVGWQPFANAFHFLIGIFNRWVDFAASFPLYREGLQLNLMQTLGIYASLILAYFLIIKKRYFLIIISILLTCGIVMFPISTEKPGKDILRISCLDCGQGDLSFLELPGGEKLLIDLGPPAELSGGKICLLRWLQKRRIKAIDYVIITHAHNDHYGGLPEVFGMLDVKCLVTDASFWDDIEDIEIENVINKENCKKITLQDTFKMELGDVIMRFIHPAKDFTETDANNNSLVLMLQYRKFRALFTGDIEKEAETAILEKYGNGLKADFLKVPHHGSLSSSTSEFIKTVDPEVCFIPAGKNNRFGFPDRLVRNRYSHLQEGRIIAAEDGAMILETDGISYDYRVMLRK
jgi:competence protein ComEC